MSFYELSRQGSRHPTVDIYALAASLYYAVTGQCPTKSFDRKYDGEELVSPHDWGSGISYQLNQAILQGMALEAKDRPQSIDAWLALLPASDSDDLLTPSESDTDDLSSEMGVDYRMLRDLLKAGKWKEADNKTAVVMLKAANRERAGWLRIEDIENFPCTDLRTINTLWVKYSHGRFGFSVQKRIWESVGGNPDADYETCYRFGGIVGWRVKDEWLDYSDMTFNENAPKGHLPFGGEGWDGMEVIVSSLASRLVECNINTPEEPPITTEPAAAFEKEIFISYAWRGESEEFVNRLDQVFQSQGISIVRDKRDLGYKGLIKEFMERIGRGKCVIVVISDRYLKSPNCMYELVQIAKSGEFYNRIFPIVLADAKIYDPVDRADYIIHWEEEIDKLQAKIKQIKSFANLPSLQRSINEYTEIRATIDGLTDTLQNMNTLTPDIHSESDFNVLINAIQQQVDT